MSDDELFDDLWAEIDAHIGFDDDKPKTPRKAKPVYGKPAPKNKAHCVNVDDITQRAINKRLNK